MHVLEDCGWPAACIKNLQLYQLSHLQLLFRCFLGEKLEEEKKRAKAGGSITMGGERVDSLQTCPYRVGLEGYRPLMASLISGS